MPATNSESNDLRTSRHPHCWVCAPANQDGLAVDFRPDGAGAVEGSFPCGQRYAGYSGLLHGGVVSALLDGAMTNCLLARGFSGVTADLQVRFLHPVIIGKPVTVRGWLERTRGRIQILGADLQQDGRVLATAVGKFLKHPADTPSEPSGGHHEENRHHHL